MSQLITLMLIPNGNPWLSQKSQKKVELTAISRNDILRKHGVIPEKPPSPTPLIEEALAEARKQAHENRLEGKGLEELDELEDEEDDEFLEHYRYARLSNYSHSDIDMPAASNGWPNYPPSPGLVYSTRSSRFRNQTTPAT